MTSCGLGLRPTACNTNATAFSPRKYQQLIISFVRRLNRSLLILPALSWVNRFRIAKSNLSDRVFQIVVSQLLHNIQSNLPKYTSADNDINTCAYTNTQLTMELTTVTRFVPIAFINRRADLTPTHPPRLPRILRLLSLIPQRRFEYHLQALSAVARYNRERLLWVLHPFSKP
jgi:hypothetical protein